MVYNFFLKNFCSRYWDFYAVFEISINRSISPAPKRSTGEQYDKMGQHGCLWSNRKQFWILNTALMWIYVYINNFFHLGPFLIMKRSTIRDIKLCIWSNYDPVLFLHAWKVRFSSNIKVALLSFMLIGWR